MSAYVRVATFEEVQFLFSLLIVFSRTLFTTFLVSLRGGQLPFLIVYVAIVSFCIQKKTFGGRKESLALKAYP